ncbi:MAG: hypothetical protein A2Y17_07410 [Clostridiales bacterium GWF2_38_85]|nr:MAG: hypothetical protein A2Y17_07410 [Clostridiales bacterium GWF2_38_85]HBL84300.1 glycosyltransferase WbuB [Clostridiales bacterium]
MKKIHDVLFLCQFFYPEYVSSATLPFDTATYLSSHGLKVGVLCGFPKEYTSKQKIKKNEYLNGIKIKRIRYLQCSRKKFIGRILNYFSFTISCLFHINNIRHYKNVIVYSNPPILPLIAVISNKLFHTKIYFVCYDVYPEIAHVTGNLHEGSIISKIMSKINNSIVKNCNKIIALTDEMKDFIINNRKSISSNNIEVIPNWAHEKINKAEINFVLGIDKGDFIISFLGNMGTCQEMDTLLEVAKLLKNEYCIKFLFIGHGNKKESIKNMIIKECLQNVIVMDFLVGEELQNIINISSCFAISLEQGLKGLCAPSKYYSYLQSGKPILAIVQDNSYIANEIKDKKIGIAIRQGDCAQLAKEIINLKNDPEKIAEFSENSRKLYMNSYTKELCNAKYLKLFH